MKTQHLFTHCTLPVLLLLCLSSCQQGVRQRETESVCLSGTMVLTANPCTTNPCMPGLELALRTERGDYYLSGGMQYADYMVIHDVTIHEYDSVYVCGLATKYTSTTNRDYWSISVDSIAVLQHFERQYMTLHGRVAVAPNPCTDEPCMPGLGVVIRATNGDFYDGVFQAGDYYVDGYWFQGELPITIDEVTIHEGDSVLVVGLATQYVDTHDNPFFGIDIDYIDVK